MIWFDRLYPLAMLASPLVVTLFARPSAGADPARCRVLARRVWLATLLALAVHIAMQVAFETGALPRQDLHRGFVAAFPLMVFFPIFFGLARPLLIARQPERWTRFPVQRTERSASLTPRHVADPVSLSSWRVGWVLYGLFSMATVWTGLDSGNYYLVLGLMFFPGFAYGARASLVESEPRDTSGSPEVAAAWDRYRSFRSHSFLVCGLAGSALFALAGACIVLKPELAGWLGGLGGGLVGLGGAAFGVLASVRRARIEARLNELSGRGGQAG